VVPAFIRAYLNQEPPVIYGDGAATRDFTFVSNAVLALLSGGSSTAKLMGQSVNIGAGRRTSILELATALAESCGVPHIQPIFKPVRTGDVKHSQADIAAAKALIGYEPIASLAEGLAETVHWSRRVLAGKDA
jgi:nucleoside-diphosphate-sugar epimerase